MHSEVSLLFKGELQKATRSNQSGNVTKAIMERDGLYGDLTQRLLFLFYSEKYWCH